MSSYRSLSSNSEKRLPDLPKDDDSVPGSWRRNLRRINIAVWLWEWLSLFFSISCVGAILILLLHFDNRPLPQWSYGLTFNGIISVLAVVAKSSMLLPVAEALGQLKWAWVFSGRRPMMDFEHFDRASRGPWGSITLLWVLRCWHLGSIGAFLTVSAILMEPFLQQVPNYVPHTQPSGPASMAVSKYYTDWFWQDNFSLNSSVKGALYSSVFGDERQKAYIPTCSSGNCTWPTYTSLAVCSKCVPIPQLWYNVSLLRTNITKTNPNAYGDLMTLSGRDLTFYLTTEPAMSTVMPKYSNNTVLNAMFFYWSPGRNTSDPNSGDYPDPLLSPPNSIDECRLYMCLQTYDGHTTSGVFKETILSSWPDYDQYMPNQTQMVQYEYHNAGTFPGLAAVKDVNYTMAPPHSSEVYHYSLLTLELLQDWIPKLFSGSIHTTHSGTPSDHTASTNDQWSASDIMHAFYEYSTSTLGSNITSFNVSFPSTKGPGGLMDRIAQGMTARIRSHGSPDDFATGAVLEVDTFVVARWLWSLPSVAFLLLTLILLVTTMLHSKRQKVPIWKTSSLAALLHGVDDDSFVLSDGDSLAQMEQAVSRQEVVMNKAVARWRLRRVDAEDRVLLP